MDTLKAFSYLLKKTGLSFLFLFFLPVLFSSCSNDPEAGETVIRISFTDGTEWGGEKVYAAWIVNESESFYQNIYVCSRVNLQNLTGTGLPFWDMNFRDFFTQSEIDAVTGATVKDGDFAVRAVLDDEDITEFTVYFEIDHSWDDNDWFSDQPAVVYAVDVNLEGGVSVYYPVFIGWTPNEITADVIPGTPAGTLQTETRYITNKNDGSGGFGGAEPHSATALVGGLAVEINR